MDVSDREAREQLDVKSEGDEFGWRIVDTSGRLCISAFHDACLVRAAQSCQLVGLGSII